MMYSLGTAEQLKKLGISNDLVGKVFDTVGRALLESEGDVVEAVNKLASFMYEGEDERKAAAYVLVSDMLYAGMQLTTGQKRSVAEFIAFMGSGVE